MFNAEETNKAILFTVYNHYSASDIRDKKHHNIISLFQLHIVQTFHNVCKKTKTEENTQHFKIFWKFFSKTAIILFLISFFTNKKIAIKELPNFTLISPFFSSKVKTRLTVIFLKKILIYR